MGAWVVTINSSQPKTIGLLCAPVSAWENWFTVCIASNVGARGITQRITRAQLAGVALPMVAASCGIALLQAGDGGAASWRLLCDMGWDDNFLFA